ncbi:unnamed protein product [Peronospora belbahrii]|uniref:DIRP domain-containing protein n=1 Tax=Peronospora belbahrii TaxID=622444 RepID=A0AAU9KQ26_9STRA|nr:unnamed protein product [Peronospora belbahrii]
MLQSTQVLGPRWSLKELRAFYILLKAHGQQWDKIDEHLPHRSSAMVRALFAMHRGYLSLSEASVEGFCAIMMDQYAMEDKENMKISPNRIEANTHVMKQEEDGARNRKKRRFERFMTIKESIRPDLSIERAQDYDSKWPLKASFKRVKRKRIMPMNSRTWLRDDEMEEVVQVYGLRLNLPWTHWFDSYLDMDFFNHNEFMECLKNVGLEKITVAARPIWSSVRASMGRPRRLSRLFFIQEKDKLETYRVIKRRFDHTQLSTDQTWPYGCSPPLQPGMSVIVWVESQRHFRLATVAAFSATEGTCEVSFCDNVSLLDTMECSLNNVMVLTCPPWSGKSEVSAAEPKLSATTLLRRENGLRGATPILSAPKDETYSIGDRHHDEKIRAILAVKSLLHRKEKIVSSMAHLNEHAAEEKMQFHEKDAVDFSLWATPTTTSSAAVKDLAWITSCERRQLQKQHSWLAANLNATNKHLKTALLTLQSFSATNSSGAESSGTNLAYRSASPEWGNMMPTETLTEGQIRWAIDFLAASQRKSAIVVAESASQIVKDDKGRSSLNTLGNDIRLGNVLPETMQLVANCVTLVSILHLHVAASPDVPPVVTQKLVERVLELLRPSHETNMDLYAELLAAADAAQAQMMVQASTSQVDQD